MTSTTNAHDLFNAERDEIWSHAYRYGVSQASVLSFKAPLTGSPEADEVGNLYADFYVFVEGNESYAGPLADHSRCFGRWLAYSGDYV